MTEHPRFTVVLGITGSIAAYKAADLTRRLRDLRDPDNSERRVDVRIILTENGAKFVTPVTLQTLSGNPVNTDQFASERQWDVEHVGLADAADVILIAPATANIIAKLANGLADDLLSSVTLACTAPLLIAPAMNVHMWENQATQANVGILKERGARFIGPSTGELACGYKGSGRFAPIEEIVASVEELFLNPQSRTAKCDLAGRSVLITAGPTREYLDPVRFITNPSSGKMGYALAISAQARGAKVTLVSGPVDLAPPAEVSIVNVTSTREMAEAALKEAPKADIIIGAAAPLDFAPARKAEQKIKKSGKKAESLELLATTDILAEIGAAKRPGQVLIAFAAESEHLEENAREKLARKHADLIVANDITAKDAGFAVDTNRAILIYADGKRETLSLQSKQAIAERILDTAASLMLTET